VKHTVILGSYNRPKLVSEAIASVRAQTNGEWQLIITDDASDEPTLTAIQQALAGVPTVYTTRFHPALLLNFLAGSALVVENPDRPTWRGDAATRAVKGINAVLRHAQGDIVHYLADDDYYDAGAFAAFDELFARPEVMVGYGRLVYVSRDRQPTGEQRYFAGPVHDPYCVLDHNQVAHRRACFERVPSWEETDHGDYASDGRFFQALTRAYGPAHGIDRVVGYKRMHGHNMQATREQTGVVRES
jgi:glycosyltransferase involved in cell wall biosynthesis